MSSPPPHRFYHFHHSSDKIHFCQYGVHTNKIIYLSICVCDENKESDWSG